MLRPKEVVCRWVDAFNAHDAEAAANLYHDNAVNHQVANEPVEGERSNQGNVRGGICGSRYDGNRGKYF